MDDDNRPAPFFKASQCYFTDEGLVFVCESEAEAQRAYCEGQLKGYKLKLNGNELILLAFGKEETERRRREREGNSDE